MPFFVLPPVSSPPAIVTLADSTSQPSLETLLTAKASREGWSESQAEWIGKLGAAAYASSAVQAPPSPELFDGLFKTGIRQLTVGYFNDALSRGKTRLVAFLTIVDLESQVITRRGGQAPDYPDAWVKAAYLKVEEAASRGADSAEQIETGMAEIRRQAASNGASKP